MEVAARREHLTTAEWARLRGASGPPPEPVRLAAGPLTADLHGTDLRYVRLGAVELVRRLQIVVRDDRWRTVPAEVLSVDVDQEPDRFEVAFRLAHRLEGLDLDVRGTISGSADGRLGYAMDGGAKTAFAYCRIGLVVLHPPREHAGRPFRARGEHGGFTGELPLLVGPMGAENGVSRPLFEPFDELHVELQAGGTLSYRFAGDLFEIEDQRNWADASFKTYSTPIAGGFPHRIAAGGHLRQRVDVDATQVVPHAPDRVPGPPTLTVGGDVGAALPPLGLCLDAGAYHPAALDRVRALGIAHLRVEIRAAEPGAADAVRAAREACERAGAAMELALLAREGDGERLDEIGAALDGADIARVLVYDPDAKPASPTETTAGALVELVRRRLGTALDGGVPVGGGTAQFLCELNRTRPDTTAMDVVVYGTDATFHEADELSLVETLEAQGDAVRTARALAGGADVVVSPTRLVSARNPRVLAAAAAGDGAAAQVDPRQAALLLAGWTVGSIKHAAEAGAAALTYYDVSGPSGIMAPARPAGLRPPFPSEPWAPYPVCEAFAALASLRGAPLVACVSSAPLQATGLALRTSDGVRLLAVNLTPDRLTVRVDAHAPARDLTLGPYELAVVTLPLTRDSEEDITMAPVDEHRRQ